MKQGRGEKPTTPRPIPNRNYPHRFKVEIIEDKENNISKVSVRDFWAEPIALGGNARMDVKIVHCLTEEVEKMIKTIKDEFRKNDEYKIGEIEY